MVNTVNTVIIHNNNDDHKFYFENRVIIYINESVFTFTQKNINLLVFVLQFKNVSFQSCDYSKISVLHLIDISVYN